MVKIISLTATVHAAASHVPLLSEQVEGYSKGKPRPFVVCRVETDTGLVGYGFTGRFMASEVSQALNTSIFEIISGSDPRDLELIHERVRRSLNPRNMTGVITCALSALDIALWDIKGQDAGCSISQLLGGARTKASVYITFGMPQYNLDQLVEAAKITVKQGYGILKMVVGVDPGGWREDARRIVAVREAIGPDVGLVIDANEAFTYLEAVHLAQAISACSITWFEEPVSDNDARHMAALRRKTGIAVSAGQMEEHPRRFREFIEHQAVDILQPNVCYCGGFTGGAKIAHMAEIYGLPIANGAGWPLLNVHLMTGMQNGWLVEHHIAQTGMMEAVFLNPPVPVDGFLEAPIGSGLGLQINIDGLDDSRIL